MENYLVIKGNKLLRHAAAWINFKNIISERSQT